jgi:hypothetical protein
VLRGPTPIGVTLATLSFAVACETATGPSAALVLERHVRPSATNPAITAWNEEHYVWIAPSAVAPTRLLVLLPGTDGLPADATMIGAIAARQGYYVVGLMYPDDVAVVAVCIDPRDTSCMSDVRTEIIEGTDRSPYVAIDYTNSIDGRLASLLRYLNRTYPTEGWATFLDSAAPRWDAIAVAGLSQGGGHAAFIAKLRPVARVVMFGAPVDGFAGQPAPWINGGATPASRYYGLVHQHDPFSSVLPNWLALGMGDFGPLTFVEQSAPPFGGSHMLTTDLLPATGFYRDAHASVFMDAYTQLAPDGAPVLAPAWQYLLGQARDSRARGPSGVAVLGRATPTAHAYVRSKAPSGSMP